MNLSKRDIQELHIYCVKYRASMQRGYTPTSKEDALFLAASNSIYQSDQWDRKQLLAVVT